jgi:hypothetical protein
MWLLVRFISTAADAIRMSWLGVPQWTAIALNWQWQRGFRAISTVSIRV